MHAIFGVENMARLSIRHCSYNVSLSCQQSWRVVSLGHQLFYHHHKEPGEKDRYCQGERQREGENYQKVVSSSRKNNPIAAIIFMPWKSMNSVELP